MRFIAFLIAGLFTVNSYATYFPLKARGQSGFSQRVENFQSPNNLVTKVNDNTVLIESGNGNILSNPSFEHHTAATDWTSTTVTPSESTSTRIHGNKSLCFTASSQAWTLHQDSTLYAAQFADGIPGTAAIRIKTNHNAAITVCPRKAGAATTDCITLDTLARNNTWGLSRIPFVLGGTSNGIIVSASSGSGTTCLDDATVEMAKDFDTVPVVTGETLIVPTSSWVANTTTSGSYRLVGDRFEGRFKATLSGAPTATNLTFTLPSGFVVDTTKQPLAVGNGLPVVGSVMIRNATTNLTYGGKVFLSNSTTLLVAFDDDNATGSFSSTVTATTPFTFASGDGVEIKFSVPIVGQSSTVNTYTGQCQTDIECANEFSARTASGAIASESLDWINGNPVVSTNTFTYTFNAGVFTAIPSCECTAAPGASTNDITCSINNVSASQVVLQTSNNGSGTALNHHLSCRKQGSDYKARRQIVGSFKDHVKSIGSGSGADIQSVYFGSSADCSTNCTTGTCTICNQVGSKITSVTHAGTAGVYRLNGIDGTKYNCKGSGIGVNYMPITHNRTVSTSSYVQMVSGTGTSNLDTNKASVTCTGKE